MSEDAAQQLPVDFRPSEEREHDAGEASDEIDPGCGPEAEDTRPNNPQANLDNRH